MQSYRASSEPGSVCKPAKSKFLIPSILQGILYMKTVRLIHWKPEEAKIKAAFLEQEGFIVWGGPPEQRDLFKELENRPPDVILIDLSYFPNEGRDLATMIRMRKNNQKIPILFAGGDSDDVAAVRRKFPEGWFCGWNEVGRTLRIIEPAGSPHSPAKEKAALAEGRAAGVFPQVARFLQDLNQFPARAAYALGFGSWIGDRTLLLTTRGCKSGKKRVTPLQYEKIAGQITLDAALGQKPDWFQNILADPQVAVAVESRRITGKARIVTDPARVADFLEIKYQRHPNRVDRIFRSERISIPPTREDLERYARQLAVVIIEPDAE